MADFPAERSEGGNLRLTHDPESGCGGCPFHGFDVCRASGVRLLDLWKRYVPHPDCPLRSGSVTVAPSGEESPPDGGGE